MTIYKLDKSNRKECNRKRKAWTSVICALLLSVVLDDEFDDAASVKNLMSIRYQKMKSKNRQRSSKNRILHFE